jgi:hypothetical protein
MSRTILCAVAVVLLSIGPWLCGATGTASAESESVAKISADDLDSGRVVVIGRLGTPMKTMKTVRGTWQSADGKDHPAKAAKAIAADPHRFEVSLVGVMERPVATGEKPDKATDRDDGVQKP